MLTYIVVYIFFGMCYTKLLHVLISKHNSWRNILECMVFGEMSCEKLTSYEISMNVLFWPVNIVKILFLLWCVLVGVVIDVLVLIYSFLFETTDK